MSNMKFAIRKLAITCVLPAALWQGPLMSDAFAQNPFPTANSKMNADRPQKRPMTNKKAPPAKQQVPATNTQPQYPAAQLPASNNAAPVYQVANPSAQFQPQQSDQEGQGNQEGPETDVQRQLRLLYEKSGREMPAMDLSEMEVPEPQPGVAPSGPDGATQMPSQFAQPPVPPQKNPNFFERVFLGRKTPPRQAPPRAPFVPQPQPRPIVPNGMPPGTPPAANYRPYQPGQQPQPGQQVPQGYNGQRPGVPNQPAATPQPNPQQQQAPQVMLQRPVGQPQVIPPPQPGVQAQPQNSVVPPQQIQTPAQFNPQPTGGGVPQATQQAEDDVPLLDEEPEESLEFDLNPKTAAPPQGNATPLITPSQGAAAPGPTANEGPTAKEAFGAEPAKPATPTDPAPASENPFSGLRLNIPEAAVPTSRARNTPAAGPAQTPAAGPVQTPSASPAANATLPSNPATPPAATVLPGKDNPFLDDEDFEENEQTDAFAEPAKPLTPPASQDIAPPAVMQAPAATRSFEIAPIQPPETTAPRTIKRVAPTAKTVDQPVARTTPLSAADERLKKLADAPEKTGLKGFCPVALRQKGQLIESKPQFNATYRDQKFHFSSIAAKAAFEKEPQLFIPRHGGLDGVSLLDSEKSLPGSLDHAVWYQGQLYLFASAQNRESFVNDPDRFLDHGETKPRVTKTALGPGKAARPTKPQATSPAAIPANVTVQPAAQTTPQATASDDDLPVLSDDLEELKLTPIETNPTVPTTQGTPARIPTLTPVDAGKEGSTTRDAPAPVTPKAKVANPPVAPPTHQPGPQLESPILKRATRNTPASFVVPSTPSRSTTTPPRLISPDLKLAPPVRQ